MKTKKKFDCVAMKHRAQKQIREELAGKSREEEIAYFREGAAEFERRLRKALSAKEKNAEGGAGGQ